MPHHTTQQVLGINPYSSYRAMTPNKLAEKIVGTMKAPTDVIQTYTRHVTLLVKLIKLITNAMLKAGGLGACSHF